jgi:glycosyltransferase involved in cell wall biosynthesis
MEKKKVLIFVVAYNHQSFIKNTLARIPDTVWENDEYSIDVLIIDDQSADKTFHEAVHFASNATYHNIIVLYNPINQGYGGNQKLGYHYAIQNGYDAVVLLHGDGQYAPEYLDQMIRPLINDEADVVFGSRMLNKIDALRGKMPLYKWVGNQVLTFIQNRLLGSSLAEFHTGYRAYRVNALRSVPFAFNSDYFDFDTDIIIQMLDTGKRIVEIPIPTYYGEEISYVNGFKYAWLILTTTLQSRLVPLGILYNPKFDYQAENEQYPLKLGYASSHQYALDHLQPGMTVFDIGCGPGFMAEVLDSREIKVISIDRYILPLAKQHSIRTIEADIETYQFQPEDFRDVDMVLMLDIIAYLREPEKFLAQLRTQFLFNRPPIIITTGNVGFLPIRLALLFGWFNYGKKGIVSRGYHRLFTFALLNRTLQQAGFDVLEVKGIPAPYPLALGNNFFSRLLVRLNAFLSYIAKGIGAYQIAIIAQARPTLDHLLENAHSASQAKREEVS